MTVFITGAATGIGLEAARALRERGDRVIIGARSDARSAQARAQLGSTLETVEMDMASLDSVRAGAARVRELAPVLDVLINNAGVLETKKSVGEDGHESTWAVNVRGPFLLCELLVPSLEAARDPRVVNVGSVAYKAGKLVFDDFEFSSRKYSGWAAYAQSKLALLLLTQEFARRHRRIAANCVHPGGIATQIYRNVPALLRAVLLRVLPGPSAGAVPVVFLATEPGLARVTGKYFDKTLEVTPTAAAVNDVDAGRLYDYLTRETNSDARVNPTSPPNVRT